MQTSGASILVHAIIFFGLITIFTIAINLWNLFGIWFNWLLYRMPLDRLQTYNQTVS
ncbi:unnamed protein product [Brassica oleracea]